MQNVTRFRIRFLEDLVKTSTALYWERRAEAIAETAPRPGDYPGDALAWARSHGWDVRDLDRDSLPAELLAAWHYATTQRLAAASARAEASALECRRHAALIRHAGRLGVALPALEALAEAARNATGDEPDQLTAWAQARADAQAWRARA